MPHGKKLLVSLLVQDFIDLKRLPEDNRSNRWWAQCEGSLMMALDLLRQQDEDMCSSSRQQRSAKCISRLASFGGGAKNDDVRSLVARLYHVIASGSCSEFAARFYNYIDPSGTLQNVCF
ncbi:hypothetical protein PAMP_008446 [Pampus punctatissimus]